MASHEGRIETFMGHTAQILRFEWIAVVTLLAAIFGLLAPRTAAPNMVPEPGAAAGWFSSGSARVPLSLHRCTTVAAADREHARCPHRHAGTHFLARDGATVNMLNSRTVHIVEPCSSSHDQGEQSPDPYILWFVAGAPIQPPDVTQPCPSAVVSHPFPYALPPYAAGTPNPNNPDPLRTYDIVTRHWAEPTICYSVNVPSGSNQFTDVFASAPAPFGVPFAYSFLNFGQDIDSIMDELNRHVNVGIQTLRAADTSTNWDLAVTASAGGAALSSMVGNFIWDFHCNGPTGDGVNEFIFLRNPSVINSAGPTGGLTSTLMDVSTGQIIECDVVYQTGSATTVAGIWGAWGPRFSTALAHEIGHFFGLDHTNLHPGGTAPLTSASPTSGTRIAFNNISEIPAMTGVYIVNDTLVGGRVGTLSGSASPWKSDDLAGLASLYPVQTLTATKRHSINDCASITGSIVELSGTFSRGLYALNIFLIPMPASVPGAAPQGGPVVGTISGTARLGLNDVTGVQDTILLRRTSGQFRIDGIPVSSTGAVTRYAIVVEPMTFINIPQSSFGEWWSEGVINAVGLGLNTWPAHHLIIPTYLTPGAFSDALINDFGLNTLGGGGTVQVGSIDMVPGTVINLAAGITAGGGVQLEGGFGVSRPLVKIPYYTRHVTPNSCVVPVQVMHNFGGSPLTVSAVLNGVALLVVPVSMTGGPNGVMAWTSTFNVSMPALIPAGSVFRFQAKESGGTIRTVAGMGEARY